MIDYLIDTNILLRRMQINSPQRPITKRALRILASQGNRLCIASQNLQEFWYVATRSVARNGLALTPAQAMRKLYALKRSFNFLPDTPDIYNEWEDLVTSLNITDSLSYDARLVAVMHVYGLTHILTFNVTDFKRFSSIIAVDPATI